MTSQQGIPMRTRRVSGFSLIELMVVVAIIVGCNAGNPLMHMSLLYQ